ncbi:hypothetical protein LMG33818_002494 [Halomonadaceae bacterium LMG 33818]
MRESSVYKISCHGCWQNEILEKIMHAKIENFDVSELHASMKLYMYVRVNARRNHMYSLVTDKSVKEYLFGYPLVADENLKDFELKLIYHR